MTTASRLQRSSVSFRRQGSSGRIWNDPLRTLDLKQGPSPTAAAAVVSPLAPSPRAAGATASLSPSASLSSPRSFRCHHGSSVDGGGGDGAGGILESPDVADSNSPAMAAAEPVVVGGGDGVEEAGAPPERRNRRRRRLSSAFCACMGHPPASHAQQ